MVKSVYLNRDGKPKPVAVKTPEDPEAAKLYPFFSLTDRDRLNQEATGRIHSEWKWPTSVEKENAALPILFAADDETEILLLGDPNCARAVCATPRPDIGKPEDWNSVGQHSALYLSLFYSRVKAGETVGARARLIYRKRSKNSAAEHLQLYSEFLGLHANF